jgi:hypothetical protein
MPLCLVLAGNCSGHLSCPSGGGWEWLIPPFLGGHIPCISPFKYTGSAWSGSVWRTVSLVSTLQVPTVELEGVCWV